MIHSQGYHYDKILINLLFTCLKTADALNLFELATTLSVVVGVAAGALLVCESCERVSGEFESFDMKLSRSDWHLLSSKMQRLYLIFVAYAQQTPNIQGYGNISCNRETFKRVIFFPFHDYQNCLVFESRIDSIPWIIISFFARLSPKLIHGGFSYFMAIRQIYGQISLN